MSDRYKQLIFPDDVVVFRPEKHTHREMYPNFSESDRDEKFEIGDRVKVNERLRDIRYVGQEGIIVKFCQYFGIQVDFDNSGLCFIKEKYLEKVRVHLAVCQNLEQNDIHLKAPKIHYEIKEIKGRFYKYARWWDGDRHRSKYIGKCTLTETSIHR